jgi:cellulose synthase/poly-beta-1,6-N-acetylglucosamine synthase-like glycosyltransferase
MTTWLFWGFAALVVYVYAGYPLLAWTMAEIGSLNISKLEGFKTRVTFVVSACNEELVLAEKLRNTAALQYPRDLLTVMVVSDGSTDNTVEIAESFEGVRVVDVPERMGKSEALNRALPHLDGDIVVFSDANVMYESDALARIVLPFSDARVGCVCGELRYRDAAAPSARAEGWYWKYESWLRSCEGRRGALISPNGTLFAVRRSLLRPLHPLAANDFQSAEDVASQGALLVYAPEARAWEHSVVSLSEEFHRKTRIAAGCAQVVFDGIFDMPAARAFRLFSHKMLRWTAGLWLAGLYACSAMLAPQGGFYLYVFMGQSVFYALAMPAWLVPGLGRKFPFYIPLYLLVVQAAALVGLWKCFSGTHRPTWESPLSNRRIPKEGA